MLKAKVYKSTGSWYKIKTETGEWRDARTAGKIRLEGSKSTNPVAVGDDVWYRDEGDNAVITGVLDRKNHIVRKSNKLSKQTQILASNIDLLVILASLKDPKTSLGFIDRMSVAAEAFQIPALLCFNKMDTWSEQDFNEYAHIKNIYENAGISVLSVSALKQTGLIAVRQALESKTVLVAGHSGVGKSSLLNALSPSLKLNIGKTSQVHQKGRHTTTFAEMHDLGNNTLVIDTPGIREFGLIAIEEAELPNYFPEMFALLPDCKFYNCKHLNEPKCAVLQSLENGGIPASRYHSYLSILENEDIFQ